MDDIWNRLILLGTVVAIGGLAALMAGFYLANQDAEMKDWPVVTGRLTNASLERTKIARLYVPSVRGSPPADPMWKHEDVWALTVHYDYEVAGRAFSGSRATSTLLLDTIVKATDAPSSRLRSAHATLQRDSVVQVHYRQTDPNDSYLLYVDSPSVRQAYTIGAVLFSLGAAATCVGIAMRRT